MWGGTGSSPPPVSAMITSAVVVETPGDGDEPVAGGLKGRHHFLDTCGEGIDLAGVLIDEVQMQCHQECVVLGEAAL